MVRAFVLCPGQGAQRVGMGKDVADRFPEARAVFDRADEALGTRLSALMWEGPEDELTLTHNAQPAILIHTLAVHAVVAGTLDPVGAAGHSLGEYSAYAALGWLGLEDAVRLVRRRGELMLEAGQRRAGTMAAVLGLEPDAVEAACRDASQGDEVVVPANLNAPGQIVVSGDPAAVDRVSEALRAAGAKRVMPLKVSGAFHSPLMAPAAQGLRATLADVTLTATLAPVIANATAEVVREAERARELLGEQLLAPVRWVESMRQAIALADGASFVELGPGNVLAGLLKRIDRGVPATSLGTVPEIETFMEAHA